MIGWLRLVLMIFYAPFRGIREARDRGSLLPIAVITFVTQAAYSLILTHYVGSPVANTPGQLWGVIFRAAMIVVVIGVVFVPIVALLANIVDRRGSFRVVMTQEYAPLAATLFYVLTVTNIVTILIATFLHYSGIQGAWVATWLQNVDKIRSSSPLVNPQDLTDPRFIGAALLIAVKPWMFLVGMIKSVREVFRVSVLRSIAISLLSLMIVVFTGPVWTYLFSRIIGSPFLFLMVFLLLRGYFSDFLGQQRAKAAFKQNLESATLNPADASAHYNLGLIHQSRGELDQAVERFKRAVEIDPEEVDASYQLGRIARSQKKYVEAIQNFEQVVARNPAHSLHEIWREVAATYIGAGQYEDARNALEQFLEHRPSDPEGLYLMGCAHAGLGHRREATSLMQQCIEAVKSAPAYKYRTSKRWMNEAEQFIKSGE